MLQQTKVPRVAEAFPRFVRRFPSWKKLAAAQLAEVFGAWQGLGYNRRAKHLLESARIVSNRYRGRLPKEIPSLMKLPGIGPATAASIRVYAYNQPAVFVETNIRAVFIHHFFEGHSSVPDELLIPLVEKTLDRADPSLWYSALMDYGTSLKRLHNNPARRSAHWKKQGAFEGSNRQARGKVIAKLLKSSHPLRPKEIAARTELPHALLQRILKELTSEGLLQSAGGRFTP